jgi:hypothetical protein
MLQPRPSGVETARVIVPMKPFTGVTVIVAVVEDPMLRLSNVTLVANETSGVSDERGSTFTRIIAVWVCTPSVPVIVTV